MVAYLGHSSLNPELSQVIAPKLIWSSSSTFQRHHQLSTSEDTASCLLGRLDTHQRASLCGQLEFVSGTFLIQYTSGSLPYILLFTQAPILVWFDGTIIDISTIHLQCTTVVMLGYDWWLCMMINKSVYSSITVGFSPTLCRCASSMPTSYQ